MAYAWREGENGTLPKLPDYPPDGGDFDLSAEGVAFVEVSPPLGACLEVTLFLLLLPPLLPQLLPRW